MAKRTKVYTRFYVARSVEPATTSPVSSSWTPINQFSHFAASQAAITPVNPREVGR
jgi:hypothetical protein